ncbi:hypothetical protein EYC84_010184 [Monilinia fructicola]|uniref:Uncharacterized protein n=1 Tax=Monilinia fructicola TaxID=38448 RepID=A0A5M9JED5_MONFR|nr:hypothetical protein EYC84_010184 [Monilinia fructicola]
MPTIGLYSSLLLYAISTFDSGSEGQGTGAGPTKGGSGGSGSSKSPEDASAQSGGSRSKEAKETGSSPTGGSIKESGGKNKNPEEKRVHGASPKIHSEDQPEPERRDMTEPHKEVEEENGHRRSS